MLQLYKRQIRAENFRLEYSMGKSLVLAEKPSVARDIARVLGCGQKSNGAIEGSKYIVTWALGHLVTLADPEVYDQKYQKWNMEDLPMLPEPLKLEVIPSTRAQYGTVKQLMLRKDVDEIIIATDAGREGELVARWILEKVNVKKPIKRLWVSSVTDKAIKEGFSKLKEGKGYENLYASAFARSAADWYVGINATRALTTKFNAQLSCGRVQTPTLAMVAQREAEIQTFKSKEFYGLTIMAKGLHLTWIEGKTGSSQTFDKDKIEKVESSIKGQPIKITDVEIQNKKTYAPGLYDLTELQREANKRYGFSAKQTLNLMQKLYEEHKVLTYPRTDSRYLSSDIVSTLKDRVKACGTSEYGVFAGQILKAPIQTSKSFVDDSKVSDHHAIIPTEQLVLLNHMTPDERKVYDLVVKRFLAVLMPAFEYEQTSIMAAIKDEKFKAKGKRILQSGWKAVYGNSYEDEPDSDDPSKSVKDQQLPLVKKGDTFYIEGTRITKGNTQPPAYHTEGTLLSAMEKPSRHMTCGIGTVATRADIIEKLLNAFLMEKKGQHLHMTSKGKQLLELVPKDLKTPDLTAEWESKLEKIATGQLNKKVFIEEIKKYSKATIQEIKSSTAVFRHDNLSREKCPDCGKYMLEVSGKKGKLLVCQDRECGYRKSVSLVTNARCPNCHKKLELRGEGDNKTFFCKCGHREKLESFNRRRQEETQKADKRDVQKYLEKMKKEQESTEPDSPFAAALKNLKL